MRRSSVRARFDRVGAVLRLVREKQGRAQAQVARAAGLPASMLSKYEAGVQVPTLANLSKVLDALGLSAADFGAALDAASGHAPRPPAAGHEPAAGARDPPPQEVAIVAEILLGAAAAEHSAEARRAFAEVLAALHRLARAVKPGSAAESDDEEKG